MLLQAVHVAERDQNRRRPGLALERRQVLPLGIRPVALRLVRLAPQLVHAGRIRRDLRELQELLLRQHAG